LTAPIEDIDERQMVEEDMIRSAQEDAEAFRALYRRLFPRVYAYVAYRVGSRQDAEDVSAEIFFRVIRALAGFKYHGAGSFEAWVFQIARHQVATFFRQADHDRIIPLDALPDLRGEDPPDQAYQRKEQFARLRTLILTLSPRRQEIVTLRFFGGLRNQEIAAVLRLDERTVASHLSRALRDLEDRLKDDDREEETHDDS